jgi:hypothetical protein
MRLAGALAALALAGCNMADRQRNDTGAQNQANGAAVNEAAVTPVSNSQTLNGAGEIDSGNAELAVAPPRPDPSGISREWFAGAWTDTGDCVDAGEFGRDGRYRLADGTRGMWNVQGGRLIIENEGGRRVVRLRKIANDAVEIINANGAAGRSTRCAHGGSGRQAAPAPAPAAPEPSAVPTPG